MDARALRERRKARIAARLATAQEEMPEWLEDKIEDESEEGTDVGPEGDADERESEATAEGDESEEAEDLEELAEDIEELSEDLEEVNENEAAEDAEEAAEEEEEPAAEPEGDEPEEAPADEEAEGNVTAAFNYNPIYQKPTHLRTNGPSGGYHYFGPLPDAGTSYGYYTDAESKLNFIAPIAKAVFSPVTGKRMSCGGRVGIDGLASVLAMSDQMIQIPLQGGDSRYTSARVDRSVASRLFDTTTGRAIAEQMEEEMEDYNEPADLGQGLDEDMDEDELEAEVDRIMGMDEEELPVDEPAEDAPLDEEALEAEVDRIMAMDEEDESPMEEALEDESPMEEALEDEGPEMDEDELEAEVDRIMAMDEDEVPMDEPAPDDEAPVVEDEELPEEDDDTEAVRYEALQEVDELGDDVTESDVHMTLFDQERDGSVLANPYWNIDIKGQPVARVYLGDQDKPEEIRAVFCSADYHRGVAGAIEKVGAGPVFKQIKAKAWSLKIDEKELSRKIKADVESDANNRVVATTKNLMGDLLQRVAIVCAGMDKNFYREEGNPLKEALWAELNRFGIANPSPMIEAAFRQGATPYFETVLAKAVEYMEMEPKALAQVRKAIGEADVLAPEGTAGDQLPDATPTSPEEMPTLSERLAASSVAVAGIPALSGDALGDHKQALRAELRLGGAGPRIKR